jgi:hypothetical protein
MKLSNQNIYNLRGCQMPLVGANHFWGCAPPPRTPRKSVPGYDVLRYLALFAAIGEQVGEDGSTMVFNGLKCCLFSQGIQPANDC